MAPGLPIDAQWYIDDNANTGGGFRCRVVFDAGSVFGVDFGVTVVDVPPLVGLHCRPADGNATTCRAMSGGAACRPIRSSAIATVMG